MLRAPFLALGVVLVAASAGSGDYELRVGGETICAKDLASCESAVDAIREGRWPIAARDAAAGCHPHPGCFPRESLCVPGYDGPRAEGYCR